MIRVKLFYSIFIIFLLSVNCFAQFKIYSNSKDIYFQSNVETRDIIPYVVWFDLDSNRFISLVNNRWINGIKPLVNGKFTCPKFNGKIAQIPEKCPDNHRCFVGAAFVYDNSSYDISIYPLSEKALFERLKGQWYFISKQSSNYQFVPGVKVNSENSDKESIDNEENNVDIEKPDFYKFDNSKNLFLFANTNAGLFEIVDLSEKDSPKIIDKFKLNGEPKEIYSIDNYYVLISMADNRTVINSFSFKNSKITPVDNLTLNGVFIESRRKNNVIFTVINRGYENTVVNALMLNAEGKLENLAEKKFHSYLHIVAIFNNYLALVFKNYDDSFSEIITVIPITEFSNPLENEINIKISENIPSDRHIYFKDNYLMFMASPDWRDLNKGSTFYVYKIDNSSAKLVASLSGIAPGEQLHGTVFSNNRAYVVTFKRKDPLWVIDISNPEHPAIVGELSVPGWSDKLFFHNNRLLSTGYLDNLVSIGLFDVTNPEDVELLSRITPFENEVKYSSSEATSDERAFYINWDNGVAALPIETWYNKYYNFVQAIGIDNNSLQNLGLSPLPFSAKRSFWIDKDYVVAFSSRELRVFKEENGKLIEISNLPLTLSADFINQYKDNIALFSGYNSIYRFSLLNFDNLEEIKGYTIDGYYRNVVLNKNNNKILFYNINPLRFMLYSDDKFIRKSFELDYHRIEDYYRLNPILSDNRIILPIIFYKMKIPYINKTFSSYGVKLFKLPDFEENKIFSSPGRPVDIDTYGNLITYETGNNDSSMRINLLKVTDLGLILLDSINISECNANSSQVVVGKSKIFINCKKPEFHNILKEEIPSFSNIENQSRIVILNSGEHLSVEKTVYLDKKVRLIKVNEDANLILVSPEYYYLYAYIPIWYQPECEIYNIENSPKLIKNIVELECSNSRNVILTDSEVIIGEREKGVKKISLYYGNR